MTRVGRGHTLTLKNKKIRFTLSRLLYDRIFRKTHTRRSGRLFFDDFFLFSIKIRDAFKKGVSQKETECKAVKNITHRLLEGGHTLTLTYNNYTQAQKSASFTRAGTRSLLRIISDQGTRKPKKGRGV